MIGAIITAGLSVLALSTYELNKLMEEENKDPKKAREQYIEMLEELGSIKTKQSKNN